MLQAVENLARARHDSVWQPGEARDLDAVAAVGAAGDDLAQKHDLLFPFPRDHVKVRDARQRVGEIGQLVIVRGEDRFRTGTPVGRKMLGYGPRETEPVEGGGAAPDLVEDHEALR